MVLTGDNAIGRWRELMGATDYPGGEGHVRRDFATDIQQNVVHGSDCPGNRDLRNRVLLQPVRNLRLMAAEVNRANIAIVLVQPNISENIGAAARAMCNMGLSRLILVNPPRCD